MGWLPKDVEFSMRTGVCCCPEATRHVLTLLEELREAVISVMWSFDNGLLRTCSTKDVLKAFKEVREGLEKARTALKSMSAESFVKGYSSAASALRNMAPGLDLPAPSDREVRAFFSSLSSYYEEHGNMPVDYYLVEDLITTISSSLLARLIEELELKASLEELGLLVKGPYDEEADEERAYKWLMEHAGR